MVKRLPREVYVLQSGLVLNAFGNGAASPFLVIYLHDVRGIPLALAGLAATTSAAFGLAATVISGSLADRLGARATTIGGLALSTAGFALYPLVHEAWHAIALGLVTGSGIGTWLTGQTALVAAVTPRELRHVAFAQQRVAANLGIGLGAFAGGIIVSVGDPASFTRLFLLDAVTFALYAGFIARLPDTRVPPRPGGYAAVLRDRPFAGVAALNLVWVATTIALFNGLFPVFARNEGGISERSIGFLFLANTLTIVVLQLPIARALEGRRRMPSLALMALLFAAWSLTLAGTGAWLDGRLAVGVLAAGVAVLGIGECLYDSIHGPLVADLAPDGATGRYLAVSGFSWQLGFILAPAIGGAALGAEPFALWPACAGLCLAGGALALRLEQVLPAEARTTGR
jgi:MFS family permease